MRILFALVGLYLLAPTAAPLAKAEEKNYQGPFLIPVEGSVPRKPARVFLPLQHNREKRWPILVSLHGFGGSGERHEDDYLKLKEYASRFGFVLVLPEGTRNATGQQFWNATNACCDFGGTKVNDVAYLTDLLSKVNAAYHGDPSQVLVLGHSNGGFMANRLACDHPELFVGAVSLAGGAYKDPAMCKSRTPINFLQIHARNDSTVAYGDHPYYAGAEGSIAQWKERNGCVGEPAAERMDLLASIPGEDTSAELWTCGNNRVGFWSIDGFSGDGHYPHLPFFGPGFVDRLVSDTKWCRGCSK